MTRAKDHLSLIVPHRFYMTQQARSGDKHLYAMRSRFIPSSITEHFDQQTWPRTVRAEHTAVTSSVTTVDLGARMRGRWRKTGS
ncbi:MAG: ATP-dependent helicase, partial [Hyphomicrobium sp.]|nr:ATP-dependent helicase [Hyphomicrobium sp.]